MQRNILSISVASILLCITTFAVADYKDDIGYTKLLERYTDVADGSGVTVYQVEGTDSSSRYRPSATTSGTGTEFTGKTFTFIDTSTVTGTSVHAVDVAENFYGNTISIASGVTDIYSSSASYYLNYILNYAGGAMGAPVTAYGKIQNNSWIGANSGTNSTELNLLNRLDYQINRDNFVNVVGVANYETGYTTPYNPQYNLLACSYNSIAVGVSSGNHYYGDTSAVNGAGRLKPDLVSTSYGGLGGYKTSYATAVVSSAAAILWDKAGETGLNNARNSYVMKALLLGGTTKDGLKTSATLPGMPNHEWSHTEYDPIDQVFGAGQLNIYNSYRMLTAGEQTASSSVDVSEIGWDQGTASSSTAQKYFFEITSDNAAAGMKFAATLAWNASTSVLTYNNISLSLANLDLKLYTADGYVLGDLLEQSISGADGSTSQNVELIYTDLAVGRYCLEVLSNTNNINYGLVWGNVPEPATITLLILGGAALLRRRKF